MKKWIRRGGIVLAIALLIAGYWFFFMLADSVGADMNNTVTPGPYTASEEATALWDSILIADLHADSLLWNRDLTKEGAYGHVDVPRLLEANVAVQAFTVVTKVPSGQNVEENSADAFDMISLLALGNRWPLRTVFSLKERALYQAEKLNKTSERSGGKLVLIKTKGDLESFLEAREDNPEMVAGYLGIEGGHCLEGDIDNLQLMFDAGYRQLGPTHFFDNELGGSAHGQTMGGLTEFGREVITRMEELHMVIDVAHASPEMTTEILEMATTPVVSSHTGVKGTCDSQRNLSDEHVLGIAATGGVVGIGVWKEAVCDRSAEAVAKAMRYVADLAGVDHVGLGSDFDGAVNAPFDIRGTILIVEALQAEGFSDEDIGKIMGGNTLRVLRDVLPE